MWHDEAEKTRTGRTYELAENAYRVFLATFPNDKDDEFEPPDEMDSRSITEILTDTDEDGYKNNYFARDRRILLEKRRDGLVT